MALRLQVSDGRARPERPTVAFSYHSRAGGRACDDFPMAPRIARGEINGQCSRTGCVLGSCVGSEPVSNLETGTQPRVPLIVVARSERKATRRVGLSTVNSPGDRSDGGPRKGLRRRSIAT